MLCEILNIASLKQFPPLFCSTFPACTVHVHALDNHWSNLSLFLLLQSLDCTHSITACLLSPHLLCVSLFSGLVSVVLLFTKGIYLFSVFAPFAFFCSYCLVLYLLSELSHVFIPSLMSPFCSNKIFFIPEPPPSLPSKKS